LLTQSIIGPMFHLLFDLGTWICVVATGYCY
jgi:hypothetical protein